MKVGEGGIRDDVGFYRVCFFEPERETSAVISIFTGKSSLLLKDEGDSAMFL